VVVPAAVEQDDLVVEVVQANVRRARGGDAPVERLLPLRRASD
jgi:hypothetical protein